MRDSPGQQFHHFTLWEDWHNGLYATGRRVSTVGDCITLLKSPGLFADVLSDVAEQWPVATSQNLSNQLRNHQSWCGRAACNLEYGATLQEVNEAWNWLLPDEQAAANAVADDFTNRWRSRHMAGQTVFTYE